MRTFPRRRALLAGLAVVAVTASVVPAASQPATAAPGSADPVTVLLSLAPSDESALLQATSLGRADAALRGQLADRATPSVTARLRAVRYLAAHGFDVVRQSNWLVTARGTTSAADLAFGTGRLHSGPAKAARPVAVPQALQGVVSAVHGLTRSSWRPRAVPTGLTRADLLSAYDVSPLGSGAGVTIATVHFSGWNSNDLQTYATAAGLPMPTVQQVVALDGSPVALDDPMGEFEAALDQETLLATAPDATQRMYFAGNSDPAAIDVYDRVADDAEAGLVDVVSVSWGQCEPEVAPATRDAIDLSLARIVAAGRTVFAASGDLGAHDCDESSLHAGELTADYPASSPHVVAVGGTTLQSGNEWSEIGWSQPATEDSMAYASGGGFSAHTARPSWQPASTVDDPPAPAPDMRMLPDISAVADPRRGVGIYVESAGGWHLGGGTSLATATVAGHFASTLSALNLPNGLGQPLQPLLYANPSVFRDVTTGGNFGYVARAGYDLVTGLGSPRWWNIYSLIAQAPIVSAPAVTNTTTIPVTITPPANVTYTAYQICENAVALTCATEKITTLPAEPTLVVAPGSRPVRIVVVGWDSSDGQHPGIANTLLDQSAPTAAAAARFISGTATAARFSWSGADPAGQSGVLRYQAIVRKLGTATPVLNYTGTTRSWTKTLAQGGIYTLYARSEDRAGNFSAWKTAKVTVPYDQTAFARSSGWRLGRNWRNFRGTTRYSATRGRWLTKKVYGGSVDLIVSTGPTGGYLYVYVNGRYVRRINTYSSTRTYRKYVRIATWSTNGTRKVTVKVAGKHSRYSRGNTVIVDGLRVNRR